MWVCIRFSLCLMTEGRPKTRKFRRPFNVTSRRKTRQQFPNSYLCIYLSSKTQTDIQKPPKELESCKQIFGKANGSKLCSDVNFYQPEQPPISKIKSYPHKKYSYLWYSLSQPERKNTWRVASEMRISLPNLSPVKLTEAFCLNATNALHSQKSPVCKQP